ncbi:hypothetical protein [Halalkalibacter alkaliphilus]|uniref:Uncharacterized protein n=1 Tax=Halalkalibacter alkaliphilus TaxID=2917993 RepID=A0A9X2CU63_9BACI|nr:hypothetical protein [Halalkalibacter alkaliphilus]MCL7748361.1 hypothetical protein [Halalkalibacter alkaliphilus]
MEQLIEFVEAQQAWLFLIGVVIVGFLLISLLKTLFKFAVILLVVAIGAVVLFDMAPEDLAEGGVNSVKKGTAFIQDKMIPMMSEGFLEELFKQPISINELLDELELNNHNEQDTIVEVIKENK